MSKKSWKNKNKEVEQNPQRYNWKKVKVFNTYIEAKNHRDALKEGTLSKINRCGTGGLKFVVKVGTPAK